MGVLGLYFFGFDVVDDVFVFDVFFVGGWVVLLFMVVVDGVDVDVYILMFFFDEVFWGVELEVWKQGFVLMVGVGWDDLDCLIVCDMVGWVDGLMVFVWSVLDDVLVNFVCCILVVVLFGFLCGDYYDYVMVSNVEVMGELMWYVLLQVGDGDVVFFVGFVDFLDGEQWWEGVMVVVVVVGCVFVDVICGDFMCVLG